jgi:putative oxidoreductase
MTVIGMCLFGVAFFLIGAWSARNEIAAAPGLDKITAVTNLCFGVPLAVFGALHLFGPRFVVDIVPAFMPWPSFWVVFVGCALIAASMSIVTGVAVRWSGLLFGIMMFLFVATIHLPGALRQPHDRIIWTIVFRELSFGGAGWLLAGHAAEGGRGAGRRTLITVGRSLVTMALIVFGIFHFLRPTGLPGVPLRKEMPAWVPGREIIDWVTGAALLLTAGSVFLRRRTRTVATLVGGWILLMILVIYAPVLVLALSDPLLNVRLEGVNYFADTLLFAGTILALAKTASQRPERS